MDSLWLLLTWVRVCPRIAWPLRRPSCLREVRPSIGPGRNVARLEPTAKNRGPRSSARDRTIRENRTATVEEDLRLPSTGAGRECILQIQVDDRQRSSSQDTWWANDRSRARVQHTQCDERHGSASFLRHQSMKQRWLGPWPAVSIRAPTPRIIDDLRDRHASHIVLRPAFSCSSDFRKGGRISGHMSTATTPSISMRRTFCVPAPDGVSSCEAITRVPRIRVSHVKPSPRVSAVTRHSVSGRPGCLIRTLLPTSNCPSSKRLTVSNLAVHCGHRSTSSVALQTINGEPRTRSRTRHCPAAPRAARRTFPREILDPAKRSPRS